MAVMDDILTFEEALKDSEKYSKRHLILGNGFSIACRADIFHYGSLFSQADFTAAQEVLSVFESLETQDFEAAIRALENAAKILPAYVKDGKNAAAKMREHADALKEILVSTIAQNHPDRPGDISDEKYSACRRFLSAFLHGDQGQVFTLNYDLLLYWALMHNDDALEEGFNLSTNDGFGNDEDEPDLEYVVWQGETGAHNARVHFLHGALHLFDSGSELKKYTWIRKGIPLVEQTRSAISGNAYPLFVAEGTSIQKKNKIRHNAYLYQGYKQLTANIQQGKHCFFVYGHSLAENDNHILLRIARGRFPKLYVSIFGDPTSAENKWVVERAQKLTTLRTAKSPLEVTFYDASSAEVWG